MDKYETLESTLPNGKVKKYYKHDLFKFPEELIVQMPTKNLSEQLQWVKETEIREDDVLIAAYPKTGTHWTWEILNMILRGSSEYQKQTKVAAMLELSTKEMTSELTSPRVLNTHLSHTLMPTGIKEKNCKIIHVMRNPKDVAVSFFFHVANQMKAYGMSDLTPPFALFAKTFRGVNTGQHQLCSYLDYIKHWEQFRKDNPDYPLLNVFYEDVKKDPIREIKKLAKFVGKEVSDELAQKIHERCQFQNLKAAHENKDDVMKKQVEDGGAFVYRKGTVGDWKNYLTVADSEEFDEWIQKELKDTDITFQYEL